MEKNQPTIIIVAYNRENSLKRLLKSVSKANYPNNDVKLVISIDKSDNEKIYNIANNFKWHGEKRIIKHPQNLGLKEHILTCGDLTSEYGSVIILEDDLFVSEFFYHFAFEALKYYANEESVSGISLYSYKYLENFDLVFHPYISEYDTYYIQYASSWGQAWTSKQWNLFRKWYGENKNWSKNELRIPEFVHTWSECSWKKYFIKYLIENERYIIYPYNSYSTNFGEIGVNEGYKNNLHQVNLSQGLKINFSNNKFYYDAYFQINPSFLKQMNEKLKEYDFDVDLMGNKPKEICKNKYLLTIRKCQRPALEFGLMLYPPELNIIYNISGKDLFLVKKENVDFKVFSNKEVLKYYYSLSENAISKIQSLLPPLRNQLINQTLYNLKKKLGIKFKW